MRPRPYVVAEKLGMPMKYLDTETAHSLHILVIMHYRRK